MISRALYAVEQGFAYVRKHPQVLFALLLVIVLPLAFLYSGNQFLEAGKANQEKLQKDRIGMLHDVFASVMQISKFDAALIDEEIDELASLNQDISKFRVVRFDGGEVIPIAALDESVIGVPEDEIVSYQSAAVRLDESIIFEFFVDKVRMWQSFRVVVAPDGTLYVIMTETSQESVDSHLRSNQQSAYFTLALIYLFVLAIAYWHIRVTDYRYLYKKAEAAIKTKDLFTNMIAHELRAPLTAIRGYASMTTESKTATEESKKYAHRIQESAERLITVVNDLLEVARIQSGKLKVSPEEIDLSQMMIKVSDELRSLAEEKHIDLICTGIEEPHPIIADPVRLQQALTNLVSNALKYTTQGTIEMSVENKLGAVELRVKDTGMGISASDQKKLFAPFFRVQSDDVSEITGTGLGMWITRQLIELMGATIGVESIKGVGTHVVVTIPVGSKKSSN